MVANTLPNNRNKIYGGAWSIRDTWALKEIQNVPEQDMDTAEFCSLYHAWVANNRDFKGWQSFKHLDFSNGTTETFDKFYLEHQGLRLRLLKGEYFYHQIQARLLFKDRFEWLDKDTLAKGDVVVMSCPFSDTGNVPDNLDDILTVCDRLDVPVMLDMAYISMSDIKHLDLSHQCIKVLTTSLSKIFPVEQHRIGLRMRREFKDDTLVAYNQNQYVNRHSVNIGNHMIKTFSNDWLVDRYKQRQQDLCRRLEVVPSSCVIFGIDHDHHFNEYNRGGASNRLCFSKVFDGRSS
jgi:hypothetical protein